MSYHSTPDHIFQDEIYYNRIQLSGPCTLMWSLLGSQKCTIFRTIKFHFYDSAFSLMCSTDSQGPLKFQCFSQQPIFFHLYVDIHLFWFSIRSQQFVETEKISVMGHTFSSKADIICSRLDTRSDNPIICVCKVCASFYNLDIPISVSYVFLIMMCITCYFAMNKKNFAMRIDIYNRVLYPLEFSFVQAKKKEGNQ